MDNKISFKSQIKFVSLADYRNIVNMRCLSNKNYIGTGIGYKFIGKVKTKKYLDEAFTREIRTCSAGGLVSPKRFAVGFHFFHDNHTFRRLPDVFNNEIFRRFQPQRALLLGGKKLDKCPYSMKNFEKIKTLIMNKVENVSFFERHRHMDSESHLYYSLKDDTWIIATEYTTKDKRKQVLSLKDLKAAFKKIQIAKGDRLFIDNKEISSKDYPSIFVDNSSVQKGKPFLGLFDSVFEKLLQIKNNQ